MEITKKDGIRATGLEDFILLGSVKGTFDVFGQKITMQTLSVGFLRNVAVETSGLDIISRDYVWKIKILAHSMKTINGNPLVQEDPTVKTNSGDKIDEIVNIIAKWEKFVVDEAYSHYEEMMKEQKQFVDEIRKKYQKEMPQS